MFVATSFAMRSFAGRNPTKCVFSTYSLRESGYVSEITRLPFTPVNGFEILSRTPGCIAMTLIYAIIFRFESYILFLAVIVLYIMFMPLFLL